jgi:hypothetical protein
MPLAKYFGFVGSALLLLLLVLNWLLPGVKNGAITTRSTGPSSGSIQSRNYLKKSRSIQVSRRLRRRWS